MKRITVSLSGDGDYKSIEQALSDCEPNTELYIKNGIYKENLFINKPNISLIGESKTETILTYNKAAYDLNEKGEKIGTFATASVHVGKQAENFSAQNLTFENSAGMGDVVGQAVALYLDCDKAVIKNCILRARQDTLLAAPYFLDIEKDPYIKNRQYFENCLIEGDVDFIFGGAVAVFKNCEIKSLDRGSNINGYVTAACTSSLLKYGFVFFDCRFTTDSCKEGTVFLGRPWREYAKTVLIGCMLGNHISEEGFSKWNNTQRHKTCYYAQYNTSGENYDKSKLADWTNVLTEEEAKEYTLDNIFEGWIN